MGFWIAGITAAPWPWPSFCCALLLLFADSRLWRPARACCAALCLLAGLLTGHWQLFGGPWQCHAPQVERPQWLPQWQSAPKTPPRVCGTVRDVQGLPDNRLRLLLEDVRPEAARPGDVLPEDVKPADARPDDTGRENPQPEKPQPARPDLAYAPQNSLKTDAQRPERADPRDAQAQPLPGFVAWTCTKGVSIPDLQKRPWHTAPPAGQPQPPPAPEPRRRLCRRRATGAAAAARPQGPANRRTAPRPVAAGLSRQLRNPEHQYP